MGSYDARGWQEDQNDLLHSEEFDDYAECPDCGHDWNLHGDKYGCCAERGDNLAGTAALPPCGCTKVKGGAR